jgi:hypothetical protein
MVGERGEDALCYVFELDRRHIKVAIGKTIIRKSDELHDVTSLVLQMRSKFPGDNWTCAFAGVRMQFRGSSS